MMADIGICWECSNAPCVREQIGLRKCPDFRKKPKPAVYNWADAEKKLFLQRQELMEKQKGNIGRAVLFTGDLKDRMGRQVSVWYCCSVCKKPIDKTDSYCKHCGAKLEPTD